MVCAVVPFSPKRTILLNFSRRKLNTRWQYFIAQLYRNELRIVLGTSFAQGVSHCTFVPIRAA